MSSTSEFTDVKSLPSRPIDGHLITYARHHVIATETFKDSSFLKAMQVNGLWDQTSFATNGVGLVEKIDGVTASDSGYRHIVGGALHTGGHTNYNSSQIAIIGAFNDAYSKGLSTGNWGNYGSELGWLQAQAPAIHGYAAFLKTELVNPNSALKLHSSDTSRSDLKSGETWNYGDSALN